MTGMKRSALPAVLRPLFWDHDAKRLRFDHDHDLIVGRVLREGGWTHARALRTRLGDEAIREWIVSHEARGLAPSRIRFWELLLKLPTKKADAWVRAARRSIWHGRARS